MTLNTLCRQLLERSTRSLGAMHAERGLAGATSTSDDARMIVLAELRYTRPLDEVLAHVDAHRAYLRSLQERALLVLSGPLEPRTGGVLILSVDNLAHAEKLSFDDPFFRAAVAEYTFREWRPVVGAELAVAWENARMAKER